MDAQWANARRETVSGTSRVAIKRFVKLMGELTEGCRSMPIHEMLREILEKTGYEAMLKTDKSPEAESRIANLEELVNAAAEAASAARRPPIFWIMPRWLPMPMRWMSRLRCRC